MDKEIIKEVIIEKIKKILKLTRKISADKALLIWILSLAAGLFLFKLIHKELPRINTTLVFASWWEDEMEDHALANLGLEFEAQNPGVAVKLEKMNWDEIQEKLMKRQSASTGDRKKQEPPDSIDVFSIDPYAIYNRDSRLFLAVQQNMDRSSINVQPVASFINLLYYNIDLLSSAGFGRPPKNQTEFLSYTQRLKETGVIGIGLALEDSHNVNQQLLSWIWAAAGHPESTESFSFTSREVIQSLDFLNQLNQNISLNSFDLTEAELLDAFAKGRIGMMIGSIGDVKKLKKTNINFGITTIPALESYSNKPVFPLSTWYVGVNSRSLYPEESQKFVSFLLEKSEFIAVSAFAIPGNSSRILEQSKNDPYYAKAFDMYESGEMVGDLYRRANTGRFNTIVHQEIKLMFQGNKTSKECAESLQQNWQNISGMSSSYQ